MASSKRPACSIWAFGFQRETKGNRSSSDRWSVPLLVVVDQELSLGLSKGQDVFVLAPTGMGKVIVIPSCSGRR